MIKIINWKFVLTLMVLILIGFATAEAGDINAMLKKLKSSDRVEMRAPTSVAAARGMKKRDKLRGQANKESVRASIREQVQAMAAEEVKTAEFEFGKVCKDIHGEWVRVEEYLLLAPEGNTNQFKLMILNERENGEKLDYFKNLSTFSGALPTDAQEFASVARNMWSSSTVPDVYLTKVENLAANDSDDTVKWDYDNGTSVLNATTSKYEPVFKDYEYSINDVPKISYTGTALDGSDRQWTVGDPDGATVLNGVNGDSFSTWVDDNITSAPTADGGAIYETDFGGSTSATETYYIIDDDGNVTDQTADSWNQELIFGASEFDGRTIDLVIAPDLFEQSGIGYIK